MINSGIQMIGATVVPGNAQPALSGTGLTERIAESACVLVTTFAGFAKSPMKKKLVSAGSAGK